MSQPLPQQILTFVPAPRPKIPPDQRESIPLTEAVARLVTRGIEMARSAETAEALSLFDQALAIDEDNVEALLWRGGLSPANEGLPFLERAALLAPESKRVQDGLKWARQNAMPSRPVAAPPDPVAPIAPQDPEEEPTPESAPGQPFLASVRSLLPDIAGIFAGALGYLVERPTYGLIVAVMLLGLLGTAAVARASFNKGDAETPSTAVAPLAIPTELVPSTKITPKTGKAPAATATPAPVAMTLDQAWAAENWPLVVGLLDNMVRRAPTDPNLTKKLFSAHYNYGVQLAGSERMDEAIAEFDKALAIDAMDKDAQNEKRMASLFRDGVAYMAKADYGMAIPSLRSLYESRPQYHDVTAKLYESYIGYASSLEKEGNRTDAYKYFQKAAYIDTKGTDAQDGLVRLKADAPAAVKLNRKIEVDLNKQQVLVYDNNKLLWRFKASTGKYPGNTRAGNFEVLDKIENAYSKPMKWGMPLWMGIYQAGGTEDGFHAMARLESGAVLSTSVLGRPATNGCIMLSDQDETTLYNWTMIGTPVWIH